MYPPQNIWIGQNSNGLGPIVKFLKTKCDRRGLTPLDGPPLKVEFGLLAIDVGRRLRSLRLFKHLMGSGHEDNFSRPGAALKKVTKSLAAFRQGSLFDPAQIAQQARIQGSDRVAEIRHDVGVGADEGYLLKGHLANVETTFRLKQADMDNDAARLDGRRGGGPCINTDNSINDQVETVFRGRLHDWVDDGEAFFLGRCFAPQRVGFGDANFVIPAASKDQRRRQSDRAAAKD